MYISGFNYSDERFADIQLLRYRLDGFEQLAICQKIFIYYLAQATLYGRDIVFDQFGKYNLRVRKTLETIYQDRTISHDTDEFKALEVYLKRVWFSNGIYHHYGCEKFVPGFSKEYLRCVMHEVEATRLPLNSGQTVDGLCDELISIMFDESFMSKRVNKANGYDLVTSSACNYYDGVTQKEVEDYYGALKERAGDNSPSFGLNSKLVKKDGQIFEQVWSEKGLYAKAISHIIYWLSKAKNVAENDKQRYVIQKLIEYYKTGDLRKFDEYSIEWVDSVDGRVDFVNGFIEVYGDPLGIKGSWEGIVEYIDLEATKRTKTISDNAQWFEDNSPVDYRFKKKQVKGISAKVVCAAMLGGDEYPSTAIGINLPNADWIRTEYGSKSVTIGNLTHAYSEASKGNGFKDEFVTDEHIKSLMDRYGNVCDDLHTDLHECLGHGSGRLLPGVDPDALKAYGNTIEEARADLFALYYLADPYMLKLGLLDESEAYKSQYYTYILNGMLTQIVRISPGNQIEEAHMRNRALIARWCYDNGDAIHLYKKGEKTYIEITDYEKLRGLFAKLLVEVQRIKSEGDFEAARKLVEKYGVNVDPVLHEEILQRYNRLNIAPYKGFINPMMIPVTDACGNITDIKIDYSETYEHQMLRYSSEYATLI